MFKVFITLLIVISVTTTSGYKFFQQRIPNGDQVVNPCDGSIWDGVGHENRDGGGVRNPFGKAFAAEGKVWTKKLCQQDSDGDGITNGEELGDPKCKWKPGGKPDRALNITHPGICQPLDSPLCQGQFLKCDKKPWSCPAINSVDVKSLKLRLPANTKVPAKETTLMCTNLKLPADRLYDIIATRPMIDNRNVMHHMTVMGCEGDITDDEVGKVYECPMIDQRCKKVLDLWTFGMDGFCQPDYKAKRFGNGTSHWVSIQYHWNNPQEISGYTDSSGVELFYTPKLRQYSEDAFFTGDLGIAIPPNSKRHIVDGTCSQDGSKTEFSQPFNISSLLFHMHYRGRRMWAKHYRNGTLLRTIADQNPYSYESPILYQFDEPMLVIPGDEIKIRCEYNTEGYDDWILYGDGTQEEMCFAMFSYYPAGLFKVNSCFSVGNQYESNLGAPSTCNAEALIRKLAADYDIIKSVCDINDDKNCTSDCYSYITSVINSHPKCFYKSDTRYKFMYSFVLKNMLSYARMYSKSLDLLYVEVPRVFRACDLYPPTPTV